MLLYEMSNPKVAVFAFARMNPPTMAHGKLIDVAAMEARRRNGNYHIFLSQTQDHKDNPLNYETKQNIIRWLFPQHKGHIVNNTSVHTVLEAAALIYRMGYRNAVFVAGSDRLGDFENILTSYNGKSDKSYYKFDSIDFVSSGERDENSSGIEGISATKARAAAKANNPKAFAMATGAGKLSGVIMKYVRQGMMLEDRYTYQNGRGRKKLNPEELKTWTLKKLLRDVKEAATDTGERASPVQIAGSMEACLWGVRDLMKLHDWPELAMIKKNIIILLKPLKRAADKFSKEHDRMHAEFKAREEAYKNRNNDVQVTTIPESIDAAGKDFIINRLLNMTKAVLRGERAALSPKELMHLCDSYKKTYGWTEMDTIKKSLEYKAANPSIIRRSA